MISGNSKSDSSSQPDEKEEDENLFFPGIYEYHNKRILIKIMRTFDHRLNLSR